MNTKKHLTKLKVHIKGGNKMTKSWWKEMEEKNRYSDEESEFEKGELIEFYVNKLSENGLSEFDDPNSVGSEFLEKLGVTKEEAIEMLQDKSETEIRTEKRH